MPENIYPIFDSILKKDQKEKLLKQKALVIWMVGLSGSGKSTIARSLENNLYKMGLLTQLLDGDNLRSGLNRDLGFSAEHRHENIRRAAEVAKIFASCGIIVICSFISPTEDIRVMAKEIIGKTLFYEVLIDCPLEICEKRDVKGLYARARKGEINDFTGVDGPFEKPVRPSLTLQTDKESIEACQKKLLDAVLPKISY